MYKLAEILSQEVDDSYDFVKPVKVKYLKAGVERVYEYVERHDSVACLLYEEDTDKIIMVKQCRVPLLAVHGIEFTYELCAGLVEGGDVKLSMVDEIYEECGYVVAPSELEFIHSFYKDAGSTAAKQTVYFCSVKSYWKTGKGGGSETEGIEICKVSRKEARNLMSCDSENTALLSAGTLLALEWFLK